MLVSCAEPIPLKERNASAPVGTFSTSFGVYDCSDSPPELFSVPSSLRPLSAATSSAAPDWRFVSIFGRFAVAIGPAAFVRAATTFGPFAYAFTSASSASVDIASLKVESSASFEPDDACLNASIAACVSASTVHPLTSAVTAGLPLSDALSFLTSASNFALFAGCVNPTT